MKPKNNSLLLFWLKLCTYFIYFTIFRSRPTAEKMINITECGNCNSSFSGTNEITAKFHIEHDYNSNISTLVGKWDFQIPYDDSFMINWLIYRTNKNSSTLRNLLSLKFNRGCSDMLRSIGTIWKTLWDKDMPSKCPVPKGSYTLRPINLNPLMKHKSLFMPNLLSDGGLFTTFGKFIKKRTGLVAGCIYVTINVSITTQEII